jgi:hypothetical protein
MVNIWKYMVNIWIFMTFHCKFHHPNWLRFFKGVDWNHQPILDRTAVMVTCWGDWRIWKKTSGADSEENTKVTGWRTADFNIPPSPKFQSSGLSARIFWVGIEPICWTSVAPGAWKCRWRKRRSSPGGRQILSYFQHGEITKIWRGSHFGLSHHRRFFFHRIFVGSN